jgi:hypothetical protein
MNINQAVPTHKNPSPTNPLPSSIQKRQSFIAQTKHLARIASKSFVVSGLFLASLAPAQTAPSVLDTRGASLRDGLTAAREGRTTEAVETLRYLSAISGRDRPIGGGGGQDAHPPGQPVPASGRAGRGSGNLL